MIRLKIIEMHTSGEPTRIIYSGLPPFPDNISSYEGKRQYLRDHHDPIRRCLMLEPRGHSGMYGAVILPCTSSSRHTIAQVAFTCASDPGYTPMCGHATLALARFLVDYPTLVDLHSLPSQARLALPDPDGYPLDPSSGTKLLHLHVPCGILRVRVPVDPSGRLSDPSRPASFISVPSWAHPNLHIAAPSALNLPISQLGGDLAYGGGWYFILPSSSIGLHDLGDPSLPAARRAEHVALAIDMLAAVRADPSVKELIGPDNEVYGVIIGTTDCEGRDLPLEAWPGGPERALGLCVFAAGQVDRSPTGGAVAAREAAAWAKGDKKGDGGCAYHSPTSVMLGPEAAFVGSVEGECSREGGDGIEAVHIRVEGMAFYTGMLEYMVESEDPLGLDGFTI